MELKKSYSVLIVDDDIDICNIIKEYLITVRPFKSIIIATDGKDAEQKIRMQEFDILITDLNMPRMNGMKLIANLVKDKKIDPTQIIIVSGELDKFYLTQAQTMGIKNILIKPFNKETFIQRINSVLNNMPKT